MLYPCYIYGTIKNTVDGLNTFFAVHHTDVEIDLREHENTYHVHIHKTFEDIVSYRMYLEILECIMEIKKAELKQAD